MKRAGALLLALSIVAAARASERVEVRVGERLRGVELHVPFGDAGVPRPLVLIFHGGSQSAGEMEQMSGLSAAADRHGFVAAYPEGFESSWNDGRGTTRAARAGVDDVAFARALLGEIPRRTAIDPRRVYAVGISNGGLLVARLACEMADRFAAVAVVAASMSETLAEDCRPARGIPILGIHGVEDPLVPFAGGEVRGGRAIEATGRVAGGRVLSAQATREFWAGANGCGADPARTRLPSRFRDGTGVRMIRHGGGRDGSEVVWYEIAGGGHRWPPRRAERPLVERLARRGLGVSSRNLDATETIWEFFRKHER